MEVSSVFYPVDKMIARSKTQVSGNLVFSLGRQAE